MSRLGWGHIMSQLGAANSHQACWLVQLYTEGVISGWAYLVAPSIHIISSTVLVCGTQQMYRWACPLVPPPPPSPPCPLPSHIQYVWYRLVRLNKLEIYQLVLSPLSRWVDDSGRKNFFLGGGGVISLRYVPLSWVTLGRDISLGYVLKSYCVSSAVQADNDCDHRVLWAALCGGRAHEKNLRGNAALLCVTV